MAILKGLASIVSELKVERTNLANQLRHLDAALTVLGKMNGGTSYIRPGRSLTASARRRISLAQKARWAKARDGSQPAAGVAVKTGSAPAKRTMSASARRKIAAAQKARWAKAKNGSQPGVSTKTTASAPVRRTMSASARRKIAAAQKARWSKVKAGKKSAA